VPTTPAETGNADISQTGASPPAEPPPSAPLVERTEVTERRVAELEQVKLSSEHKLPITFSGMLLFNSFLNGKASGGADYPLVLTPAGQQGGAGGTFRQSVIGLKLDGPQVVGGGKVTGSVYMDFYGGGSGLNQTMRLRVATVDTTWKNTTVGFAFDKPIIAPREPDSLAQVGVSPLTGAGNLWLWQPQVRMEQRVPLGTHAGLRAQTGVYQTAEGGTGLTNYYADSLATSRPGYESRIEFWKESGNRRVELAPGIHASSTRVAGKSIPSRIYSVDWLFRPHARIDFTGTFFAGKNTGVVGGLRQGVSIMNGRAVAVRGTGGWAQLKIRTTARLQVNLFGGQQDDRNRDLMPGGVQKNQSYGANMMYLWGSNIQTSFEASQVRTSYQGTGTRINPHYDLAFAYLF
jgi:hypothetical protein